MSDELKLLACPFCGSTDEIYHTGGLISCDNCGCEGPDRQLDYRAAWNRRATAAPQSPVLQDVKDAERFRLAIAYEDNAGLLYTATINHGGDVDAIRREFDEEAIDFAALKQEKKESP